MGIGVSIFLLAAGAILTFAVDWHVAGVDLDIVGWILMAAGALGLIVTTIIWGSRRRTAVVEEPTDYQRVDERRDVPPPSVR